MNRLLAALVTFALATPALAAPAGAIDLDHLAPARFEFGDQAALPRTVRASDVVVIAIRDDGATRRSTILLRSGRTVKVVARYSRPFGARAGAPLDALARLGK